MANFIVQDGYTTGRMPLVRMRCPKCKHIGSFEALLGTDLVLHGNVFMLGQRRCPNPTCQQHVFTVFDGQKNALVESYPAERIDFDSTNVPAAVSRPLEEAITCHANNAFMAAAIMVRKTLEELCRDRGATGKDLKARIADLGTKVVVPKELLDGLDDIRLLGNDAAHVESQTYNTVGKNEVEVSLEFTKEVLKAVYQYAALLAKLKALKKS